MLPGTTTPNDARSSCSSRARTSACSVSASRRSTARRHSRTMSSGPIGRRPARGFELKHLQSEHEADLVVAVHDARGAVDGDRGQCRRPFALELGTSRRLGSFRRRRGRAAPVQPRRPRALASPVGLGAGGRRDRGRLRRARLRARRRGGGATCKRARRPPSRRLASPPMPNGSDRPDLAAMDVAGRIPRLAARLAELGCDGLLVTNLTNVRYLTGFTGSAALLLVLADDALLVSDFRYRDQATAEVAAVRGAGARGDQPSRLGQSAAHRAGGEGLATPGAGGRRHHLERPAAPLLQHSLPATKLVAVPRAVETLRVVKDEGEVARIECAAGHRRRGFRTGERAPLRSADGGGVRHRPRVRDAPSRSRGGRLRVDRRRAARTGPFPMHDRPAAASTPASLSCRLRGDCGRLPVGHDADGQRRRSTSRRAARAARSGHGRTAGRGAAPSAPG